MSPDCCYEFALTRTVFPRAGHGRLPKAGTRECHLHNFACVRRDAEGTHSPACPCPPSWLPRPAHSPGPRFSRQPLPQQCHSRAGLQLLTALPCPAVGPAETGAPAGPCPGPVTAEENLVFHTEVWLHVSRYFPENEEKTDPIF